MTTEDEPAADVTALLATTLGLPPSDFVEVFGAGWTMPTTVGPDGSDPDRTDWLDPWSFSGEPFQLALRVGGHGGVELGRPVGRWGGVGTLHWEVDDRRVVSRDEVETDGRRAAADLVRRRRSSFRYCRYCRRVTAPESRISPDTCYSCASHWHGVVY